MAIDTESREYITCPYCGDENYDSWEVIKVGNELFSEKTYEDQCGNCGRKFKYKMETTVRFTTEPEAPDEQ